MIDIEALAHDFGEVSVLSGVDLTVERGEFVALVGPNGAGKTTLLRTINGVITPDEGRVTLDGDPVSALHSKEVSRRVATVPQDTHVGFAFSTEQIVEMGRTPHRSRLDWHDETDPVDRALERTNTARFRDRPVEELSGGERQRVLLARALAQETDALLLDEPTASLDINHQIDVLGLVAELVEEGKAAVAAIHDLDLAARFCDRLLLLTDGEIRAGGDPESVLTDPALSEAFGAETAVTEHPATGTPTITALERGEEHAQVHVAGSAESARRVLRTLWQAGYEVSVGPVPAGDITAQLAADLGCDRVTAPAFERVDGNSKEAALAHCQAADVVVLAGGAGTEAVVEADTTPKIRAALDCAEATANTGRSPAQTVGDGGYVDENGGYKGESARSSEPVRTPEALLAAVRDCLDE